MGQIQLLACILCAVLLPGRAMAQYALKQQYAGSNFFDGWNFFGNVDNLTLGDTFYLDRPSAFSQKLAYLNGAGNAVIRVDNFTNVQKGQKRNSIRLESKDLYDVGSLWIIDALHLPFGCSTWPAFWSKGDNWPFGGEIDIIEGINELSRNQAALHTTGGCSKQEAPNIQVGQTLGADCSIPAGCVVAETKPNSYGKSFGQNGGGVWATQFDVSGIYIWYWPRSAIPQSIRSPNESALNLADWGLPSASFPANSCDIPKFFTAQRLVLNIALCGVWAGVGNIYKSTCGGSGDPAACYEDNVVGPGSPKYDNAFFEIQYVRVYSAAAAPVPSNTSATVATTETPTIPTSIVTSTTIRPDSTTTLTRFSAAESPLSPSTTPTAQGASSSACHLPVIVVEDLNHIPEDLYVRLDYGVGVTSSP
ncbi:hypothetical protein ONZ45_g1809 [Pleurotus djamor]|nr:hypothetical protein ONZ45_g1809 [Pleurotus djamor]